MMHKMLILIGVLTVSMIAGCGSREHMRPDFGVQTREFFQKQRVYQDAAPGEPIGLDSEEAQIIYDNYREQIGGDQKTRDDDSPAKMLIIEDSKDVKEK